MVEPALTRLVKAKTDTVFIQLLRYTLVGGQAFAVDFGVLYFLTKYMHIYYLHSAALAFLCGLTTNYVLSVWWVFPNRTFQSKLAEYSIFALLGVLGLGLNHILMSVLTEQIRFHYLFSKIVATGVVFVWNFGSRKLILFHYPPPIRALSATALPNSPEEATIAAATGGAPVFVQSLEPINQRGV